MATSWLIETSPSFPMRGQNGYAGEQDGTRVLLSDIFTVRTRADAVRKFGRPAEGVRLHWASFTPGRGWDFVLGRWSGRGDDEAGWWTR